MNYDELKKEMVFFRPALALDALVSFRKRKFLTDLFSGIVAVLSIPAAVYLTLVFYFLPTDFYNVILPALPYLKVVSGMFLVAAGLWLISLALQSYFYSHYFVVLDSILREPGIQSDGPISFEAASVLYHAPKDDLTKGFVNSDQGFQILLRLGLSPSGIAEFLARRVVKLPAQVFRLRSVDKEKGITIVDLAMDIFRQDKEFADFLFKNGVQEKDLSAAASWQVREDRRAKRAERWWSRDTLGRIPGIGRDFAYGGAYILGRYAKPSFDRRVFDSELVALRGKTEELEEILVKNREANALIVGEAGGSAYDVLLSLAHEISEGRTLPPLDKKRVVLFDGNKLISATGEKTKFEAELIRVLTDGLKAGNIILAIDDFPSFFQSAAAIGSDLTSLMDPFLNSPDIQFVALSDTTRFHRHLENNRALLARFEVVTVGDTGLDGTIQLLEDEVSRYEQSGRLFFTYKAILAIAESADRYFPDGVMPDKALDLLSELVPKLLASKKNAREIIVQPADVLSLVGGKTGIPLGKVGKEEKEKLTRLEEILQKRVVGQEEAVSAVAGAMRRARSGIANPNRPMGSFLFLGPTGVGKTETTKALAEAFFGDEKNIIRLDMSEYKSADAVDKLIGSFTTGEPGVLATAVREHPYGVLLLDEFEKTTTEALDLFLQVLDEGNFSDMSGAKLSVRNMIIIATSNAGANRIWEFMKSGGDLASRKSELIDEIVSAGIFKPELLNRFDGVVLFHPIVGESLRQVARLMLEKLSKRLAERGIKLNVSDKLIDYLMRFGSDPKFGARPMNRAIQEKVEQKIADKLIRGEIKQGDSVTLTEADLA